MRLDVEEVRNFYATPLGAAARRVVRAHIRAAWPDVSTMNVAGIGYGGPYLDMFRSQARRVIGLMPDGLGALAWPDNRAAGNCSALVVEDALPLPDASMERVLLIHCLEVSEHLRPLLRQVWRVLAPEGRLLLALPNRLGMWARAEHTPFGHGRPWSQRQVQSVLREAMYEPLTCRACLYMPPLRRMPAFGGWARGWERGGRFLAPALGGLLLAEAAKRVQAPLPRKVAQPLGKRVWGAEGARAAVAAGITRGATETGHARRIDSPSRRAACESDSVLGGRTPPSFR